MDNVCGVGEVFDDLLSIQKQEDNMADIGELSEDYQVDDDKLC